MSRGKQQESMRPRRITTYENPRDPIKATDQIDQMNQRDQIDVFLRDRLGRARWGVSGALYPQSALAGSNPRPRFKVVEQWPVIGVMMVGSHARRVCEPRQIRKEATVNRQAPVPRGSSAGASITRTARQPRSTAGARPSTAGSRGEGLGYSRPSSLNPIP